MEQIFVSKEAIFYLRQVRQDKATTIYMMVRIHGKQFRLSTSVKVIPSQWNQKKQMAYVSPMLCELDNYNNQIVNSRLNVVKKRYNDFIEYICKSTKCTKLQYYNQKNTYIPTIWLKKI